MHCKFSLEPNAMHHCTESCPDDLPQTLLQIAQTNVQRDIRIKSARALYGQLILAISAFPSISIAGRSV